MEFKGHKDDLLELRNIKRSKVSRLTIQKTSMFGLGKFSSSLASCCMSRKVFFLEDVVIWTRYLECLYVQI